jgi:hypothetical protein
MRIKKVVANNRKAQLELTVTSGKMYPFPYARLEVPPTPDNKIQKIYIDHELAYQGVTYTLASGEEGSLIIEQALEYNQDPTYVSKMFLYELTLKAEEYFKKSGLSKREVARRLNTSLPQVYRLLDSIHSVLSNCA